MSHCTKISFALFLGLSTCSPGWAEPAANLIQNPGFEEVTAGQPSNWLLSGSVGLDNAQLHSGGEGLRMEHQTLATSTATQTIVCGEQEYLALAWVKVLDVTGAGARMRLLGSEGQVIAESKPLVGETVWRQINVPFNPGGLGKVTVELSLTQATGRAWFDDVMVGPAARIKSSREAQPQDPQRENIALHKPYTLTPSPNYPYCTDPGDDEQLTDGQYTEGYFWTQKSTVGWLQNTFPEITIDLGKAEPISGIMINCPGGGYAGALFPAEITYLVSDDNENFHEVARLTPKGLRQDGNHWYTHHFLADGLKTRGRYVMIRPTTAMNGTGFFFADEVEIYKGDFDPSTVKFTGQSRSGRQMRFEHLDLTPETYTRGHFPETPHVKWATPLEDGPIKSIMMSFGEYMRDVVEVAQRVDLNYAPIIHSAFYSSTRLSGAMEEEINRALPSADVMIVGAYRWEATPSALLEKIKARVREGMGLVCVTRDPDWLKPIMEIFQPPSLEGDQGILDMVPMALIPGYHRPARSHFHLATYGKGRAAWVNPEEFGHPTCALTPAFTLNDLDDDAVGPVEYYHEALGKLILWAAQREKRRITRIQATPEKVTVKVAPGTVTGKLELVMRDEFFDPVGMREVKVSEAGGSFEIKPPVGGRNGTHYVDVWLRNDRNEIVDFGSTSYRVENDARIERVTLDKPFYPVGGAVEVSARITGKPDGLRLQARLLDTNDREMVSAQIVPVNAAGETRLQLPLDHPLTLCARLYLSLRRGDAVLEKHFERVWIDLPEKDDFIFCGWYAWDFQPDAFHGMKMLRDLGVDTYVSLPGKWRAENAAYGNARHGPENVSRVGPENKDESLVRIPCLTDPAFRAKTAKYIEGVAEEARPYGVLEWSMGDESTLGYEHDYCASPTCLAEFRRYLQESYRTLEALNESWGSHFKSWDEAFPAPLAEAGKKEKIGAWLDHRRYMESVFAEYHDWCRKLIVKRIPAARVGLSGTPPLNSRSGHDWWKLLQGSVTHLSGYAGIQSEVQRSFVGPGAFFSTFLGYDYKDDNEQAARHDPWDLLFHGANGVNYYTLVSNSENCPLILPDMSLTRKAAWFFEEVREIKAGLGRLLMSAHYENDGIAIHYSPASVHAATATGLIIGDTSGGEFGVNLTNLGMILRESHYQFDFLHEQQMAKGALAGYKVLILPWSSAISPTEATAIKEFVRNGGTVIADSYCGVRDDHGKPQRMLDDLFGITQPLAKPELQSKELFFESSAAKAFPGLTTVPVASGVEKLELVGGVAQATVGAAPALIRNRFGKGQAIFLNCSFSNYAKVRAAGAGGEVLEKTESPQTVTAPIRTFVTGLLTEAGIPVPLPVTAENHLASEVEMSRLRLDQAQLVGLVRSIQEGAIDRRDLLACKVGLPEARHVYEARSGRYLGKVTEIAESLPRGIARVYVLLPYQVRKVTIAADAQTVPVQPFNLHIRVIAAGLFTQAGTHVVHLSVQGPDGKERAWYADNVVARNGKADALIPFAYNDPPGPWTVTVKDLMTGVKASRTVTVTP